MKIISDQNKLPIAQASDIDRAALEGKGAKWAQTNLHQNPDIPRHPDPAEGAFSEKEAHQRAKIPVCMYVCMYVNFISTRYIHQLLIHM